jgi:hypothetical protein
MLLSNLRKMANILKASTFPRPWPICSPCRSPDAKENEEELTAYTARWLELADAALSATEKAAKALELARREQERIRSNIKRQLDNYAKTGGRRVKKVG